MHCYRGYQQEHLEGEIPSERKQQRKHFYHVGASDFVNFTDRERCGCLKGNHLENCPSCEMFEQGSKWIPYECESEDEARRKILRYAEIRKDEMELEKPFYKRLKRAPTLKGRWLTEQRENYVYFISKCDAHKMYQSCCEFDNERCLHPLHSEENPKQHPLFSNHQNQQQIQFQQQSHQTFQHQGDSGIQFKGNIAVPDQEKGMQENKENESEDDFSSFLEQPGATPRTTASEDRGNAMAPSSLNPKFALPTKQLAASLTNQKSRSGRPVFHNYGWKNQSHPHTDYYMRTWNANCREGVYPGVVQRREKSQTYDGWKRQQKQITTPRKSPRLATPGRSRPSSARSNIAVGDLASRVGAAKPNKESTPRTPRYSPHPSPRYAGIAPKIVPGTGAAAAVSKITSPRRQPNDAPLTVSFANEPNINVLKRAPSAPPKIRSENNGTQGIGVERDDSENQQAGKPAFLANFVPTRYDELDPKYYRHLPPHYTRYIKPAGKRTPVGYSAEDCFYMYE